MAFSSEAQIENLLARFHDLTLPKAEWTHAAHLLLGLWYLDHHGLAESRRLVPEAIKRYNAAVGPSGNPRGGYHETITQFYLTVIDRFRADWRGEPGLLARANALYQAAGDRGLLLRHYSEERLWSAEARGGWLPPDILEIG